MSPVLPAVVGDAGGLVQMPASEVQARVVPENVAEEADAMGLVPDDRPLLAAEAP